MAVTPSDRPTPSSKGTAAAAAALEEERKRGTSTGMRSTTNGTSMPLQLLPGPCYAVRRGRYDVTGCVFVTWSHAYPFLDGFEDAVYKPFDDPLDATRWLLLQDDDGDEVEEETEEYGDGGKGLEGCSNASDEGGEELVRKKPASAECSSPPCANQETTASDTSAFFSADDQDSDDAASVADVAANGVTASSASTAQATSVEDSAVGGGGEGEATALSVAGRVETGEDFATTTAAGRKRGRPKRGRPKRDRPHTSSGVETDASDPFDDESDYRREKRRKRRKSIRERWNVMFHRLALYKKRHGTCEVVASGTSAANSGKGGDGSDTDAAAVEDGRADRVDNDLYKWIAVQRQEYKKLKDGSNRETTMFDEKIDKLRSIGFDFRYYTVDERIEQVRRYREVMCDPTAVPSVDHPMLGKFVKRYRKDSELHKRGRKTLHFTKEELEKLEDSLGLLLEITESSLASTSTATTTTNTRSTDGSKEDGDGENDGEIETPLRKKRRDRRPNKTWMKMYERLREYKFQHGTCDVPTFTPASSVELRELRRWIVDQRTGYKRWMEGKHPHGMYDEKVEKLRSIGFDLGHYAFEDRIEQLRRYREGKGNESIVPNVDHHLLGRFVRYAFEDCRLIDAGKEPKHYTTQQIDLLRSLPGGFNEANIESVPRFQEPSEDDEREWEFMLNEWLRYKESHNAATSNDLDLGGGHAAVPPVSKGTPLAKWVQQQRIEFRKLNFGTSGGTVSGSNGEGGGTKPPDWLVRRCKMTPRRLARLNDVGFDFGRGFGTYVSFNERLDQLRRFKEEHGHCRVPYSHPVLGKWIDNTRSKYRRFIAGHDKPHITEEQIGQLAELGFVFQAGKTPARPLLTLPWEERFKQLLEFKRVHGTTVVPQHYTGVPGLGTWVKANRSEYQKMIKGGKSWMTPQKALRLAEVGFVFNATSRRGKKVVL